MKKILLLTTILFSTVVSFAQSVSINTTGAAADTSAMLDISSHAKGILIPRLTTAERTAIVNPALGLLVFDTDTKSFWFRHAGSWKELLNNGASVLPAGAAGGDLSGSYPAPNVVKIQNLDVAAGLPQDRQALKWDAQANRWAAQNDSLFLPYNVSAANASKLFGITNTNTANGATALYGKSGAGAGTNPGTTIGVWGDNGSGIGVLGTSNAGVGLYGLSFQNHGVYGYATNNAFAGVYGAHANNGAGVMGEVSSNAIGIYGRATGSTGKAGVFENNSPSNTDTVLKVSNAGLGLNGFFTNTNASNGNAVVSVLNSGTGDGYYAELSNTANASNAAFRGINNSAGGYGIYAESVSGKSAYFFNSGNSNNSFVVDAKTAGQGSVMNLNLANASNINNLVVGTSSGLGGGISVSLTNTNSVGAGLYVSHSGTGNGMIASVKKGKAAVFSNTDATNTLPVMDVSNIGTDKAASFVTNNAGNSVAVVNVNTNGTGRGLQSTISNAASNAAAIHGSSSGSKGIEGLGQNYGVTGQSTGLTGGIGLLGQSSLNSNDGIGVKAISYSTGANPTSGALSAINNSDGTAVYAEAVGGGLAVYGKASRSNGAAIYGTNDALQGQALRGAATGTDGIGVYGEAGNVNSLSLAAYFRNSNASNNRNVVQVQTNGTGRALSINSTSASNNNEMIRVQNAGSAEFLLCVDESSDTKASIAKNGNIMTDGTITVKSNKGIVRNSSATQLRTELMSVNVPASHVSHFDQFNAAVIVNITFSTPFSSAPSVFIGNVTAGGFRGLTSTIENVTTTGCSLVLLNYTSNDFDIVASTVKIMAIGAE